MSDTGGTSWLEEDIGILPGISDKRRKLFAKLGVGTIGDLLWLMPRSYENWQERVSIAQLTQGETSVFEATIDLVPSMHRRGKLSYLRARLTDDTGSVNAIWFNQPWLAEQLQRGERYLFRGRIEDGGRKRSISNPDFRTLEVAEKSPGFLPVYPLTAGLYQGNIRQAVISALKHRNFFIEESLPHEVRVLGKLATADYALRRIHFPRSEHEQEIARRRLAFEELFLVVAGLRALKMGREKEKGPSMRLGAEVLD
ncbi:MAG TPA: OB-fold nucleic acid binding domain-containing protein, partial [Clostridia bacterium]|nr:OB-fold nucleic acid binding domain-containing protein [Clostridia bacterium]